MAQELTCPHCGAPLDYSGDAATIRCPFCSTSVVVPAELRQNATAPGQPASTTSDSGLHISWGWMGFLFLLILFIVGYAIWNEIQINKAHDASRQSRETEQARSSTPVAAVQISTAARATNAPATATPAASPTPGFASVALKFGGEGTGAGLFQDPRSIAVDNNGRVYVADYQGGRVQEFDTTGKYISQWQVGNSKSLIFDLAADRKGTVYVSADGDILRYDGSTGKALGTLPNPGGDGYGNLALRADGGLLAMWYQSRYGIITTLEGHRDDLVRFDNQGKVIKTYPSFISGQTDSFAFDTGLAVDGLGTIYALDREETGVVYKFTPEGKFVTRLLARGDKSGQLSSAQSLAVDGQGRLYVADVQGIAVFDANGRFIDNLGPQARAAAMTFDDQNRLWTVYQNQVIQYTLNQR